jgi:hypothetical protein
LKYSSTLKTLKEKMTKYMPNERTKDHIQGLTFKEFQLEQVRYKDLLPTKELVCYNMMYRRTKDSFHRHLALQFPLVVE